MTAEPTGKPAEFEPMLAEMSARLLAASPEEFDAELAGALERFVLFLGADRGGVALFEADGTVRVPHRFARSGIVTATADPADEVPEWLEQARSGRGFIMRRAGDVPAGWPKVREYVRRIGLKSHAMFPLRAGSTPIGLISVASLTHELDWPEKLLDPVAEQPAFDVDDRNPVSTDPADPQQENTFRHTGESGAKRGVGPRRTLTRGPPRP